MVGGLQVSFGAKRTRFHMKKRHSFCRARFSTSSKWEVPERWNPAEHVGPDDPWQVPWESTLLQFTSLFEQNGHRIADTADAGLQLFLFTSPGLIQLRCIPLPQGSKALLEHQPISPRCEEKKKRASVYKCLGEHLWIIYPPIRLAHKTKSKCTLYIVLHYVNMSRVTYTSCHTCACMYIMCTCVCLCSNIQNKVLPPERSLRVPVLPSVPLNNRMLLNAATWWTRTCMASMGHSADNSC